MNISVEWSKFASRLNISRAFQLVWQAYLNLGSTVTQVPSASATLPAHNSGIASPLVLSSWNGSALPP
eukprot:3942375-Amphidinium_carterae.1